MPLIRRLSETDESSSPTTNNDENPTYTFVKQMLVSRLFMGTFAERRLVESVGDYRDVVVVDSEEAELIKDLEVVTKRIRKVYSQTWIGITNPETPGAPYGWCFWVNLPKEVFGTYWYKVSRVKLTSNEFRVRLKVVRPVHRLSNALIINESKVKPLEAKTSKETSDDNNSLPSQQNDIVNITFNTEEINKFFRTVVTAENAKNAVQFLSVLLAASVTGLINLIEFLGNFTIKFMRETSNLLHAASPILIAFIDLIGKIIGGFYLLILGMWTGKGAPAQTAHKPGGVNYQSPYFYNTRQPVLQMGPKYGNYSLGNPALPAVLSAAGVARARRKLTPT